MCVEANSGWTITYIAFNPKRSNANRGIDNHVIRQHDLVLAKLDGLNVSVNVVLAQRDGLMERGTIVEWLKAEGDKVEKGDPIAMIEAEKVTFEIEAPTSGVLTRTYPAGSTIPVGAVIGQILPAGVGAAEVKPGEISVEKKETAKTVMRARIMATPAAKRVAKERGIDLAEVKGTGPNSIITRSDIASLPEDLQTPRAPETVRVVDEEEVIPLVGWRKTMAEKMAQSKATAAHITTVAEADVTDLVALRQKILPVIQDKAKLRIAHTPFIVKAVARALKEYSIINSSLAEDKIIVKKYCNVGVAMAREERGLIVPVIHHAETMSLLEIAQKLEELSEKAKTGKITLDDVRGGTFTITNVGMMGVLFNTPIINPPESAILGVGAIVKKPVVIGDQIVIRDRMYLSLSYDHRVIDGTPAIRFLQRVRELLENAYSLLDF